MQSPSLLLYLVNGITLFSWITSMKFMDTHGILELSINRDNDYKMR